MAVTKEAMVVILDIGKNSLQEDDVTAETFLQKEKACCIKLLQRKMFSTKKDEVGLIIMGTTETDNALNRTMEGYEHICEVLPLEIPNWNMVRTVEKNLKYNGANADWLDALIVAMDLLKREKEAKKFGNLKIVLFSTFSTYVNDDNVSFVIQGLKSMDIQLVVISDNVEIPEVSEEAIAQGVFSQKENKSEHQRYSEELVHRIIEESDGNLCNFEYAIQHLMKFQRKKSRPFYWYANLEIGKELKIQTACLIALKEEAHFKWSTEAATENTQCWMATEYFNNGEKILPRDEDLVKGYMLGSTPVVCDETLGATVTPIQKGIRCYAFTHKSNIASEYFSGNCMYLLMPKKGQTSSEKLFATLVRAMEKENFVMIGGRVYNTGNRPRLVCLVPNRERSFPCLSMFEMFYAEQYFYWDFPRLKSKKTEPTAEQYATVDKLMDAMDLTDVKGDSSNKEAFSSKSLMNISLQYIYETVTARALNPRQPVPTLDGKLMEALKVPIKIKENSAEVLKEIKELFPLEEKKPLDKKQLIRHLGNIPGEAGQDDLVGSNNDGAEVPLDIRNLVEVGTVTPAEDFLLLVKRGENFEKLGQQIQPIISDLVFKSMTNQNEKIAKAMMAYREEAKFYGPWDYNEWIKEFKQTIVDRKKFDFWQDVIVKDELGIIPVSQSDLIESVTDEEAQEFYVVNMGPTTGDDEGTAETVDDLFDNM